MMPFPDLTNQEFGLLFVIGPKEVGQSNPRDLWLCGCRCGNYARFVIPGVYLRAHETWSCGCDRTFNYPTFTNSLQLVVDGVVHLSAVL